MSATLKDTYERFVAKPDSDALHPEATLSYISSGTNVGGATQIVKYLLNVRHDVQISEKLLFYDAGYGSLTLEVAAECKFLNGPGWICPGVEPNLLDGMTVKLPMVCRTRGMLTRVGQNGGI
jgi:hypothetical protein